ncbi:carboxypeptidase regulatory-like domain-containing protein [Haloterrigena sp. SYSU A121-1]|uniref:Carboxypeptidase regulatory-like domain-containing protein n=1 Tax=Haloterrigena gelatinilytica TaxID=2741724 RepID=A0A8J8GPN1_9EURY|nr:carboxypeptidase-like regulatory domain-containing protein [Haloterrigena gelatinilytica]NUB92955.1 carboxypeptidase regulatory-like domain-containing protein [Haloterrigena gelatinilytica]
MTGKRTRTTVSIDDRARVPFAIIGVLLLVTSVTVVGVLQTRGGPETEIDETLAMERTEAAVQSELRGAVVDATHRAAAQPVTTSDLDALGGNQTETFETYLELLIYLEAQESLSAAGQTAGDVETTVSIGGDVPEDPDRAIRTAADRIDVAERAGGDGLLEVTLDRVTITLEDGDRVVSERTVDDLSVTVGTPILELQEKTREFETMLDEGFLDGEVTEFENMAQKTAMRLYPMAYFKSFINRMDKGTGAGQQAWTFDEILENNHTEVMANDAIFGVQEEVFGEDAVDPYADRVMRPAWACFAADMLETMAGNDDSEESNDGYQATVSVTDGFGNGVYNATVFVDGEKRGATGPGNEVSFELAENGTHSVVVIGDDYERVEQRIRFSERDSRDRIELRPSTDRTITVYDPSGEPVDGADVNVWADDELAYATTGADGTIALEDLAIDDRSELTVEIFADGYEDGSETVEIDRSYNAILTSAGDASLDDPEDGAGLHSYFEDDPSLKDAACEDFRDYLFGDKGGDLPDAPSTLELVDGMFGEMNPLTQNETVEPNDMADIAYYELIGIRDLSTVLDDLPSEMNPEDIDEPISYTEGFESRIENGDFIDDIYDVNVDRSVDVSYGSLSANRSSSFSDYEYSHSAYDSRGVTDIDVSLSQDWRTTEGEYTNRDLHSLTIDADVEIQERSVFENTTENGTDTKTLDRSPETLPVSIEVDIDADLVDDIAIDRSEIGDDFEAGTGYAGHGDLTSLSDPANFERVVTDSLETLLDVNALDSDGDLESQIEADLNDSIRISSIPSTNESTNGAISVALDIRFGVLGADAASYDFDDLEAGSNLDRAELEEWLEDDLYLVNAYVKKETNAIEQPRVGFLRSPSPFRELTDEVRAVEDELVDTESYDNVPDLVRMEVRNAYFETLTGRLDEMANFHEETVSEFDDAMSTSDGALDDSLDIVQAVFAGDVETESGELEGSELMGDMEFDVSGSPTYMDLETVDDDEVPTVRPPNTTIMDTDVDGEHAALGAKYGQRLPTPGLPLVPWPPMLYVLQVNSYNVDLQGEYSRFEVSATAGGPVDGAGTTYVRDRMDVEVDLGGDAPQKIGEVEPITFDTSLEILIAMPGLMPMKSGSPPNTGDPPFDGPPSFSDLIENLGNKDLILGYEGESDKYGDTGPLEG